MQIYDWNRMPAEQLNPLVTRKAIHSGSMTMARLVLQKGAVVPQHRHFHEQLTTIEKGALRLLFESGEQVVQAGESLVIPPHAPHGVVALEESIVLDVFSPPREDWISGDDAYLRK
jgi:quercetin dioxygenase-like cupin family protein